jgi:photosystem II stability/assembly factor-like uncharacterized protein
MKVKSLFVLLTITTLYTLPLYCQKKPEVKPNISDSIFKDLKFRNIGPAFMSGRIADIAIHPQNNNIWYVAVGSGGVWKTNNSGITWNSIFDGQSVFSTGCISIDPNNPHTIWLGTGENVGGRHVSFGDGIYKSTDDGQSWINMGLKKSEHISKIIINPESSEVIYVAAQGPLWSSGGDRGFYKSTDGGKTWVRTLGDDLWTGVTDIAIDPVNPKVIYAATWQRHRTIAAYLGGGPETAVYRSDDEGNNWKKLTKGLPSGKMGKIGLAVSPQKPDIIYAAIELDRRKGAVYKSENRGESWIKQSDAVAGATGPHYYQELYASPHQFDKIYLVDTEMQISDDGGKTFYKMNEKSKHVDNHAIAFRKSDPNYIIVGTDGGLYESFDMTKTWRFVNNLPVTQFYKVAVDDDLPFYNIYGGTQDNNTQGGPSRTINKNGILNSDWEVILFADGHQPATEPGNPNILYAEWQEGNLMRYDKKTGEMVYIQPQPSEGESFERFNWDAPLLISPHSPARLYFASHRVWRSDDRGDDWKPISGDLTQYTERLNLPVMGKKQSWDSPWDLEAMSTYNTITSLSESPKKEGLIYAGTDDGLIQITENGGEKWTKIPVNNLPGVPASAFVNDIKADLFDENTVYVCLDNHKSGNFSPYVYKSIDRGATWKSISSNLPKPLLTWRLVQDHINPDLLFLATEFGIYFTVNGGEKWIKFDIDATISFRDLAIQRRENDLVGASFGRGFFILDDYSPLRSFNENIANQQGYLFPVKKALWYIERNPLGQDGKAAQGESFFTAPNPPFGAVFTYYLKDDISGLKETRQKKESELTKNNQEINFPGWEALDKESIQESPGIFFTVIDNNDKLIIRIPAQGKQGLHRVNWDLKVQSKDPIWLSTKDNKRNSGSFMAAPGKYKVFLSKNIDGMITVITDTVEFNVEQLQKGTLKGAEAEAVASFWQELQTFRAKLSTLYMLLADTKSKADALKKALETADKNIPELYKQVFDFKMKLLQIEKKAFGSPSKQEIGEKDFPNIGIRIQTVQTGVQYSTYGPTPMHRKSFEIAKKEYKKLSDELVELTDKELPGLEKAVKDAGAPYIQGQKFD